MSGINKVSHGHDQVFEAVAVVNGGQLVVPTTGATNPGVQGVTVAGDAAVNVVGVAARRAEPVANQNLTGTDPDGFPVTYPNPVNELTAVYRQAIVPVTYTAVAVSYGTKLCAAASGAVRAWVSGTDPASAIVGECAQPGGVSSAGGTALAYIY